MANPSRHVLSYSQVQSFEGCRLRWNFSSKLRLGYRPEESPRYFDFGAAWAEAMSVYYNPVLWQQAAPIQRQLLTISRFIEVCNWHREQYKAVRVVSDEDVEQEFEERIALGKGMLKNFFAWTERFDNFTPVSVERELVVPIRTPQGRPLVCGPPQKAPRSRDEAIERLQDPLEFRQVWCGKHDEPVPVVLMIRTDGIIRDEYGNYWIKEDKTTAAFDSNARYLEFEPQYAFYAWALKQTGVNLDIKGIVWTRARKVKPEPPKILQNGNISIDKNQKTTADLFQQALEAQHWNAETEEWQNLSDGQRIRYREYYEALVAKENDEEDGPFFRRRWQSVNPGLVDGIGQRLYDLAMDMLDNPRIYPHISPWNCNACPYADVSQTWQEGGDWEFELQTNFVHASQVPTREEMWADTLEITSDKVQHADS